MQPDPPNGTPPARAADRAEFARLLAAGDHARICAEARRAGPAALDDEMLRMAIIAALERPAPGLRAALVTAALERPLTRANRAVLVKRLVADGHEGEALALLIADPAFHDPPAEADRAQIPGHPSNGRQAVLNAYVALAEHARTAPLRLAAEQVVNRLIGRVRLPPIRSPVQFPAFKPSAESQAAQPLHVIATDAAAEGDAARLRALAAQFDDWVARAPACDVELLEDVYVSARGEIWDRAGQMRRDVGRIVPAAVRAAAADAPVVEEAIDSIDGHRNFFHWTAEVLPAIGFAALPDAARWPLLICADAPAYVTESLALGPPGLSARAMPLRDVAFVRRLHLGRRDPVILREWEACAPFVESIIAAADAPAPVEAAKAPAAPGPKPPPPSEEAALLYISRRDSARRPMLNEAALEATLAARGFRCLSLDGLPLVAQVRAVRAARVIVAAHGAGLAHLLFARPGTTVLELVSMREGQHWLVLCMARLSRLRGHRHVIRVQRGHPTSPSWETDIAGVLATLDALKAG